MILIIFLEKNIMSKLFWHENQNHQKMQNIYESVPCSPDTGQMVRYYACHYGPGGNYVGRRMYSPGPPCSLCSLCSSQYQGLCQHSANRSEMTH